MAKIDGLLGLAMRAGQLTAGADLALREIKAQKAALVLVDQDASENTRKKLSDACAYRRVPMHIMEAGLLDRACGREGRMAACLKKGGICDQILRLLNQTEEPLT
ncbi:MAG: ribosomal L7Ae/L30e/S12e/Gadd45 family protein [Clostridia bacterium]|nr:ribosomal L7Ae/L30e/S12e/Gadd45 family protein [Clostridia bacterium]